eukprot:13645985-Alexandrium_andersonii.AAC.1
MRLRPRTVVDDILKGAPGVWQSAPIPPGAAPRGHCSWRPPGPDAARRLKPWACGHRHSGVRGSAWGA